MPTDLVELVRASGPGRVLAILAHPDDEALLCGGTLAAMAESGADVEVVCFSDGAQGREEVFHEACSVLGAKARMLDYPTSSISLDQRLVATTDDLIRQGDPCCVITHSRCGVQNQDHVALHEAVRLSVGRWAAPAVVVAVEPPIASTDFTPNVFVDVASAFALKCEVVALYREVLSRSYMEDDYLRGRASWWGQVAGRPGGLFEAYELLLWRP